MGSTQLQMSREKKGDMEQLVTAIKETLYAELVAEMWRNINDVKIVTLVYENYYFRCGSYAGLTMVFTQAGEVQTADIIGSAGGSGLLNMSWGANKDFVDTVALILEKFGFKDERKS